MNLCTCVVAPKYQFSAQFGYNLKHCLLSPLALLLHYKALSTLYANKALNYAKAKQPRALWGCSNL